MRPRLRVQSDGGNKNSPSSYSPTAPRPTSTYKQEEIVRPLYPHTSTFRSAAMDVSVNSASVKMARSTSHAHPLPIYGDQDTVNGTVRLASHTKPSSGRMSVSFEGLFVYMSPSARLAQGSMSTPSPKLHEHVFYSETAILSPMIDASGPLTSIAGAFASTAASIRESGSISFSSSDGTRTYAFCLPIPNKTSAGEDLPPTLSSSVLTESGIRKQAAVENVEVSYRLVVSWEPHEDSDERAIVEIPILFQPDTDFLSLDGMDVEPDSWLEIPLRAERSVPFQCAVTVPTPSLFPRFGVVPFFVVFTTTPRSRSLAREIASDATVTISLLRQVVVDTSRSRPSSLVPSPISATPTTPPSSVTSEDSDSFTTSLRRRTHSRLLKRGAKSAPPILLRARRSVVDLDSGSRADKPLPDVPAVLQDSRLLQTEMSIGFPKRPRMQTDAQGGHISLDKHNNLPDGLFRGKLQLSKTMLPSFGWAGLSVKYYLEVSVLFGQDEQRVRVPVRIY
ncbi:hypothetical protein K488DRAFT_42564 [Vararia minispora EC-137]|uniref:Uncharacterized protein n=1 Tax=Vararia minispora EC-137 TaxID=1314806 RepID=A0ACB8QVU2_9AGAM|nr:hypothetical protein K488DRAFT_42564 [Vararia minispora EC-137]